MFVITCTNNIIGSIFEDKEFPLHENGRQPAVNLETDPPKLLIREKTAIRLVNTLKANNNWLGWAFDFRPATAREIASGNIASSNHTKANSSKRRTPYVVHNRSR